MNGKLRLTKSVQQLKDEQISSMLTEIAKGIEDFKAALNSKDKQLVI